MVRHTGRRTTTLQIRLEPELKDELVQFAINEERSTSDLIRRLLKIGLATYREHPAYVRRANRLRTDGQGDASPGAQTTAAHTRG